MTHLLTALLVTLLCASFVACTPAPEPQGSFFQRYKDARPPAPEGDQIPSAPAV